MPLRSRRRPASRRPAPRRLGIQLESLEPRCLLASVALDPSFGVGGLVTTDFSGGSDAQGNPHPGSSYDSVGDALLQPDGKLLMTGTASAGGFDYFLARYNSDGTLDTQFAANGRVINDFTGDFDFGRSLALQEDGKILVAGLAHTDSMNYGVARYNGDGSLDTTFGDNGTVVVDFSGRYDTLSAVAVQNDGKIVVAGTSQETQGSSYGSIAIARLNSDGSLDGTFDGDGLFLEPANGSRDSVNALVVQSDGKLVVSGERWEDSSAFLLARYNADGSRDEAFSDDGQTTGAVAGDGRQLFVQSDGKLLQVGFGYGSGVGLARFNSDGTPDTGFGLNGVTAPSLGGRFGSAALQADGKILVSVLVLNGDHYETVLRRLNPDGRIDESFASDITLAFANESTLLTPADARLLVAGGFSTATDTDIALAQLLLYSAPSFALSTDSHTVDEDSPAQTIADFATNIAPGVNGGTVTFEIVGNTNPDLFVQQPAISNSGTLSYQPTADAWGEAVITVRAVNEGGEASEEQSFRIIVEGLNHAPVLDTSLNPSLLSLQGDAAKPYGTLVNSLLDGAVRDPDVGAVRGIAITAASNFHGDWEYRLGNSKPWQPLGEVGENAARLVPGWARLRFIPKADFAGTVKLFYRAWDQTQGVAGGAFNLVGNTGGATAFSIAKESASLTILTPGKEPPQFFTSETATVTEHGPALLLAPDMVMTDADNTSYGPNAALSFNVDYQHLAVGLRSTGTGPGQFSHSRFEKFSSGRSIAGLNYGGHSFGTATTRSNGRMDVYLHEGTTLEAIQALLRHVTVRANGDEIVTGRGAVSILFYEDRFAQSASETVFSRTPILVNKIGLNDAPELAITGGGGSYVAGDAPLRLVSQFSFRDADHHDEAFNNSTLTVSLAAGGGPADRLSLLKGKLIRVIDSQLFRGERLMGTISGGVEGQPLIVQFQQTWWSEVTDVLKHLAFSTAGSADAGGARQIQILYADGAGAEADPAFVTVDVVPSTAPVLDTSLNPTLAPAREDATNPASTLVSTLLVGAISNPDAGAGQGIAITTASNYHGTWQYRLNNYVEWLPVGDVSESSALLLPGWARLRFIPNADFNGTVKMYYRAWDQTQGSPGERFNLSGKTGGANAFSVAKEGASLTVTPVNDPPKLSLSGSIGYVADSSPITLAPFAVVSDIDSPDFAGGALRVRITDGADSSNRLLIGAAFTVDGSNNVLLDGTIIGKRTINGFGTKELVITFNSNATPSIAQQLARAIAFKTVGGAAGQRTILFTVSDGDGGLSDEALKTVNVT